MKNIKEVLAKHFSHVKFDAKLLGKINNFVDEFKTKNESHIHFFGSSSFGVYKVVMTTVDKQTWMADLCDIDEYELLQDIKKLPSIKPEWKKYNNGYNMTTMYMVHGFMNSNLPPKQKQEAMVQCLVCFNLAVLTSFMNRSFPYLTTQEVSDKVYNSLSYKFALKRLGNWNEFLDARAADTVAPNSIHYPTFKTYVPDPRVLYAISDSTVRITSTVKNLYDEMLKVKETDTRDLKTTMMIELEDGHSVRDMVGQYESYSNYLKNTLGDKRSFIKIEIAETILGLMDGNLQPTLFNDVLMKFFDEYNRKNKQTIDLVDKVLGHVFTQIQNDKEVQKKANNIAEFLVYMQSLYNAPRAREDVIEIRKLGESFIKKKVRTSNPKALAAARTGLILYILVRTFLKDKY